MSPKHSDTGSGWIKREFAAIRKELREMRAAKRAQGMTVGKGGITIDGGGSLVSRYPAALGGGEATRFGPRSTDYPGYGFRLVDEAFTTAIFQAERATPSDVFPTGYSSFAVTATCDIGSGPRGISITPDDVILYGGDTRIEHSSTGASANCFIDPSDSRIWREVSARKYKQDIEDAEVDPAAVLQMQPITYRDKGEVERDPDTEKRYVGLLAEDLVELGLTEFVTTNNEGEPEGIAYPRLTVALLAVLKDQERRLSVLEATAGNP